MNSSCDHKHVSFQLVTESLFDSQFSTKTSVCDDCGAVLADFSYRSERNKWLVNLYKEDKEKFSIQLLISENVKDFLNEFTQNYPGVTFSDLIKTCFSVYLQLSEQADYEELFNSIRESPSFLNMASSKKKIKHNIRWKPSSWFSVKGLGELFGMTPAKTLAEVVNTIAACLIESEKTVSADQKKALALRDLKHKYHVMLSAA